MLHERVKYLVKMSFVIGKIKLHFQRRGTILPALKGMENIKKPLAKLYVN